MKKEEYLRMYEQERVHWWYLGLHDLVESCVRKCSPGKPLNILDAGCGTGGMMEILRRYGRVAGIDCSPDAVALCVSRGLENLRVENLNTWEPQTDTYDLIVSNDVLSDEGIESDIALVQKFHAALKPKGYLILNLPAFACLKRAHDSAVSTQRRYRIKKILPDLEKTGFRIVRGGYRLPLLFCFILARKGLLNFLGMKPAVSSDLFPLPSFLNRSLYFLHRFENTLFEAGVPIFPGSSLFLFGQKIEMKTGTE